MGNEREREREAEIEKERERERDRERERLRNKCICSLLVIHGEKIAPWSFPKYFPAAATFWHETPNSTQ